MVVRHRLQRDPAKPPVAAPDGRLLHVPLRPIVYYLDRGAPSPVRGALLAGAGWWAEAFREAGWYDAFRVEVLPEGVDILDGRYAITQKYCRRVNACFAASRDRNVACNFCNHLD